MKLKRCPFCNTHKVSFQCNEAVWWVECLECRACGPQSLAIGRAAAMWNGEGPHQNKSALVCDRKSNHDEMKEIEP